MRNDLKLFSFILHFPSRLQASKEKVCRVPTSTCRDSERGPDSLGFHSWDGGLHFAAQVHEYRRLEGTENSLLRVSIAIRKTADARQQQNKHPPVS